jgi:two-component sensor histidine kinase
LLRNILQKLRRFWRAGLPPGSTDAYIFAVACIVAASLVRFAFASVVNGVSPLSPYYPAVLVATLIAGSSAGAAAVLLGGIIAWMTFSPPFFGLAMSASDRLMSIVVYAVSAGVIVAAAESHRRAIRRLDEQEGRWRFMVRELQHRHRNTLAVVQAIVRQTLPDHRNEAERIGGRIGALAATSDLLSQSDGQVACLKHVVLTELKPYGEKRVFVHGGNVAIAPELAGSLALIFHELATNAAKYGALSTPEGRLSVSWVLTGGTVALTWIEKDGPTVTPPAKRGFGMDFIERILDESQGKVETEFQPGGLRCRISFACPEATGNPSIAETPPNKPGRRASEQQGHRVEGAPAS